MNFLNNILMEQEIFNSRMIWFMIIIIISNSTLIVVVTNLVIKYLKLKKIVYSQQKLLCDLANLEIEKNKIKNGKI